MDLRDDSGRFAEWKMDGFVSTIDLTRVAGLRRRIVCGGGVPEETEADALVGGSWIQINAPFAEVFDRWVIARSADEHGRARLEALEAVAKAAGLVNMPPPSEANAAWSVLMAALAKLT